MNKELVQLAFLFLPGLLGDSILRKLTGVKRERVWQDFVSVFVFALLSYLLSEITLMGLNYCLDINIPLVFPILEDGNGNRQAYYLSVILGSIYGVSLGFLGAFIESRNFINKMGMRLKVSKRYGGEDVWSFFHKTFNKEFEWVIVRDHKTDLVYYGHIVAFSESEKERELLMSNVDVFSNETGEKLYSAEYIYICRNRYDLSIEIMREMNEERNERPEAD
ncbi:hypothetical protein [Phorcysia thermohydrogeniphila]|uniref:Uncharacterized protein n=1 Tax=Phorcysia thermohydrogeniphila TaxID=936138 RepID=A0A4R1GET6_9BACT|nr:hypothetical protein [Phorcysia thermohydrogeniphila]TCK05393.1 hypothetical protein CLV27_0820 [Phorcysia thermohydrogeniphila]